MLPVETWPGQVVITVLLWCQVGAVGENEDWVMVHQVSHEPEARSLEVPGLNPYTNYRYGPTPLPVSKNAGFIRTWVIRALSRVQTRFRMHQVNIVGASPPSQPSRKIQTLPAPPDMAPANVTLRTASETSLWLRWMVRRKCSRGSPSPRSHADAGLLSMFPTSLCLNGNTTGMPSRWATGCSTPARARKAGR